jgi:GT2 family glycosyltransferase
MTTSYRISVVIPTYRRCASVQRALQALARQTLPADGYEVIVSIDGSEDGTRELVAQFPAPYDLHATWQPNRGRATACNAGIRLARGELLVLLDDDMEPAPGLLAAHLQAHPAASLRGVVGAAPIIFDQSSPPVTQYIGSGFNRRLEKLARPGYTLQFRDAYSGNFSIRREVLLKVGAFDEDFKLYGHEDYELALRLLGAGVQLVYSPEALAYQDYKKDFAALARDCIARGRTAVLFAGKHPEVFDKLKLSTYRQAPRTWRLLRAGLLGLSRLQVGTPGGVCLAIACLERRRPARLHYYYTQALDYFYWLGVRSALREQPYAGHRPTFWQSRLGEHGQTST